MVRKKKSLKKLLRTLKSPQKRPLIIILSFIIVGVSLLVLSRAATSNGVSFEAESGTLLGGSIVGDNQASGGSAFRFSAQVDPTARRFFSPEASWNKTISQIGGEDTSLKSYAYRLWDYGGGVNSGAPKGTFFLDLKDYSVPIYDITTANKTVQLFQTTWAQAQLAFTETGIPIGASLPWNDNWKAGTGTDRIMAIVNYSTGKAYELWVVSDPAYNCLDIFGPNSQAGFDLGNPNHLCIAGINTYDNLWSAKDGSTIVGRGMGINKLALVVRAGEVASGNIGHALPLTTSNPMFGPNMVSPKNDPFQPGAGSSKGFYMKPATRLEHEFGNVNLGNGASPGAETDAYRAQTNPSGMRFGLNITEIDITNWLNQKGYTGAKRTTAQTFARAWRDYGAVIAETGGYGIGIETEGIIGPAKSKWAELGITDTGGNFPNGDLLDGLITRERLYVVKQSN